MLTLDQTRTKLAVYFDYRQDLVDRIKMFPGRIWKRPFWLLPLTEEQVRDVEQAFAQYGKVVKDELVVAFLSKKKEDGQEILAWKQPGVQVALDRETSFFTKPFKHQLTALAMCQKRRSFALFMEMGTGKTKVIIDMLGNWAKDATCLPFLVVAPVAVLHNWVREATQNQPYLNLAVCHGTSAQKAYVLDQLRARKLHGIVINYESLWRMEDEVKKFEWAAMVLDESTRIKHRASQQAKGIMRISQNAKRKYILTGTPAPNSPLELFNQIKFLDPTVFGTSWYAFRDRYAIMGGYGGYQVLGWKNLPELTRKLATISYRVLKKDCLDLPEKVYEEYRIQMDDGQKRTYKELAEELVTSVQGTDIVATVVLAKLTKLRQLASGFVYKTDGAALKLAKNPKLDELKDKLELLAKDHKVVVWTSFKEEIQMIQEVCGDLELSCVVLDGSVGAKQRDNVVQEFQTDPNVRVFIGQQHAGGIGITLTAADYCIFFSNDYSYEIRAQAEDRLHRIGQKNTVVYIDLIMRGTIDSTIKRMLQSKANLASSITPAQIESLVYDEEEEF